MKSLFAYLSVLCFTACPTSGDSHIQRNHARHQNTSPNVTSRGLGKHFDGARFTFYDTGLGACGAFNAPTEFVVAMNQAQYQSSNWCFKTITISYKGKTTQAKVVDECPGCPYGGLDMSIALFTYFASQDLGVIYGSWSAGDGGDQPHKTSNRDKPTPIWHPPPPKSSPAFKSWHSDTSAARSKPSSSASASSSSSARSSVTSSAKFTPSAIANVMKQQFLSQLELAMLGLADLEFAGAQAASESG